MNIAYMMAPGRGDVDEILYRLAGRLASRRIRCSGTVQINTGQPDTGPCDMDVKVLPDGPVLRISQDLGRESRGCRLDPQALENAVGLVSASLAKKPNVLIVNKFGKHEAEGRGFREVIVDALLLDIPVVVGLNALNLPAFEAFSGGLAVRLVADEAAIADWVVQAMEPVPG